MKMLSWIKKGSDNDMSQNGEQENHEQKKRKWEDINESLKYVCEGGKVQCPYCSTPIADIKVTSTDIMLQDKPWATIGDNDGKVNFNFKGNCLHPSQQKPLCPPPPCKSIINLGKWSDYSCAIVGNNEALLVKSKIPCCISMENLTIVDSGQRAELDQVKAPENDMIPHIIKGHWTNLQDEPIIQALLTDIVRFHIVTIGIPDGKKVKLIVMDDDGPFNMDDEIFSCDITINNNQGFVEIELEHEWVDYIRSDVGNEIELYGICKYGKIQEEFPDPTKYLRVYNVGYIDELECRIYVSDEGYVQFWPEHFSSMAQKQWKAACENTKNWPSGNIGIPTYRSSLKFEKPENKPDYSNVNDKDKDPNYQATDQNRIYNPYRKSSARFQRRHPPKAPASGMRAPAAIGILVVNILNEAFAGWMTYATYSEYEKIELHYSILVEQVIGDFNEVSIIGEYSEEDLFNVVNVVLYGKYDVKEELFLLGKEIYRQISRIKKI